MTDGQRQGRVRRCKLKLQKFNEGCSKLTREVLTGDKTGIYRYDQETRCCYHSSWGQTSSYYRLVHASPSPERPSNFHACAAQRWDSMFFSFFMRMPVSTQQQQRPVSFLTVSEAQLLPHSLYTPDLSTCGFFLFPRMKKQLQGSLFGNKCFHSMALCIAAEGRFFEKREKSFLFGVSRQ